MRSYAGKPARALSAALLLAAAANGWAAQVIRTDTEITVDNGMFTAVFDVEKSCGNLTGLTPAGVPQPVATALRAGLYFSEQQHWVDESWMPATGVAQTDLPDGVTLTFDCASFGGFALRKAVTIRDGSPVLQLSYQLQAAAETTPHLIVPVGLQCAAGLDRLTTPGGELPVTDLEVNSLALELKADWYGFSSSVTGHGLVVVPVSWPEMYRVNYIGRSDDDRLSLAMRLHPMRDFAPGDEVRFAHNVVLAQGDLAAAAQAGAQAGAGPIDYLPPAAQVPAADAAELSQGLRATVCPAASAPPEIDGVLDDACWESGGVMDRFIAIRGESFAAAQTTARLVHDAEALYLGVRCDEPLMGQVQADAAPGSGRVWTDDCVELFLDPEGDGTYAHLIVNAAGVRQDDLPAERAVAPAWTAAAGRGEDFWSVEIAVPFTDLEAPAPEPGQAWRMNLCRSRLPVREATCWSPTFDGFHVPERFGVLVFGAPPLQVAHVHTGLDERDGERTLRLTVANPGDAPRGLAGELTVAAPGGAAEALPIAAELPAGASQVVEAPYALRGPGEYELRLTLGSTPGATDVLCAIFTGVVHSMGLNSAVFPAEKDGNRLMVCKGTVQHLIFMPGNHSEQTYEDFSFVLTVPEGIEVIQATGEVHELYYKPTLVSREPVERDGRRFVRWVFAADRGLPPRDIATAPFYHGWIAGLIPSDDLAEGSHPFWFHLESGDEVEPEHAGELFILPEPRGAPLQHLTLGMSCWTISPTEEFWSRLLDTYRLCGINMVDAWISARDAKWSDEIHARGMASWRMLWWFWWNEAYLEAHPEHAAINFEGERDERMICPEIMIAEDNDAIAGLMDPILADVAEGRYVGTWWDLEGPGSFNVCFCDRCLAAFRQFAGIADDVELTPLKIQSSYAEQWLEFATGQTARVCARMKSYARARGVDWRLAVYSAVQNDHTRRAYRVDWTTLIPVIDVATPSFYSRGVGDLATTFTAGTRSFVELVHGLRDIPVWNTLSVGHSRTSHYIADGRITRMQIIKSVAWGADGTTQWWWGPTDGRHYTAYADASRTLAPIEDFFVDGTYAADELAGEEIAGTTRVAWRLGDELLVMLCNDTTGGDLAATATVPAGLSIARQDHDGGIALDGRALTAQVEPLNCRWVVLRP